MSVTEYVEAIEGDEKGLKHSYSDNDIVEGSMEKLYVAGHQYAPNIYDYTRDNEIIVPFIPLPADSELKTAGSTEWLTMAETTVANPAKDGVEHPCAGYDISKTDQLGFARSAARAGSCAVGASEANVDEIMDGYLEDENDLPYKREGDQTTMIPTLSADSFSMVRNGDEFIAEGAVISVYSVSGLKVTEGIGRVNISNVSNGIYIVKAVSPEGTSIAKVIK